MAITLNNLALAVGKLGDHTRERDLLEAALKIKEAHYGKEHFEVAITLNHLLAVGKLGSPSGMKMEAHYELGDHELALAGRGRGTFWRQP